MGVLDGALGPLAARLLAQFGTPGTLHRATDAAGGYDPALGEAARGADVDVPVSGTVEPYKARYGEAEVAGVRRAELTYTIAAQAVPAPPTLRDAVTVGGRRYEIARIDPTYSGEAVALYALHLVR